VGIIGTGDLISRRPRLKKHFKILFCIVGLFITSAHFLIASTIHEAARDGDLQTLKRLINQDKTLINSLDRFKYTPLDWAATRAQWPVVIYLLDKGAEVNHRGWDEGTSMHRACHYDRADIISLMIKRRGDIHVKNQWGRSPLHVASRRCCLGVASLLISEGADPHVITKEGWTPLHVAAKSGHKKMIDLLIKKGASRDIKDKLGKKPLDSVFTRPSPKPYDSARNKEYIGKYSTDEGFEVTIWQKGNHLFVTDFSFDQMVPIGKDLFFCKHEPWQVAFFRDASGQVSGLKLSFLRRSHVLKKTE
jgi:hypothetical protein